VKCCSWVAAAALLAVGQTAGAHVGAAVAVAKFTNPVEPTVAHVDPNDTVGWSGFASADGSITVTWDDGDMDPTGRFIFYYMDHAPTFQVPVEAIEGGLGTKIDDPVNNGGGYFASCFCSMDLGVTCPMVTRDPSTNCANQLTWNTSALPAGTYWLIAINNDPPFHVYNAANAPVRIAHGGAPLPPAVAVVRPDGYGSFDHSYHLQWLAAGTPPLHFDISYGVEDTGTALQPSAGIASGVAGTVNGDGTFGYDWDISSLSNNTIYWVRLQVTDGAGVSTYTDSHYGMTVYHNGTPPPDMAMAPPKKHGCGVNPDEPPLAALASALAALAGVALAFYFTRRRKS
jgi:hypothetical protein